MSERVVLFLASYLLLLSALAALSWSLALAWWVPFDFVGNLGSLVSTSLLNISMFGFSPVTECGVFR